jgi:hypothetical protein
MSDLKKQLGLFELFRHFELFWCFGLVDHFELFVILRCWRVAICSGVSRCCGRFELFGRIMLFDYFDPICLNILPLLGCCYTYTYEAVCTTLSLKLIYK